MAQHPHTVEVVEASKEDTGLRILSSESENDLRETRSGKAMRVNATPIDLIKSQEIRGKGNCANLQQLINQKNDQASKYVRKFVKITETSVW